MRHDDARRAADQPCEDRAQRRAEAVVKTLGAAAVELQDDRAARSQGNRHERRVAPKAFAERAVYMQHHAPVLAEQLAELARRLESQSEVAGRARLAMGGEVADRPAPEQAMLAVGGDCGCGTPARLRARSEHHQPEMGRRIHEVLLSEWEEKAGAVCAAARGCRNGNST